MAGYNGSMRLPALALLLFCAVAAAAQTPPCFRSKYSAEWPIKVRHVELRDGNQLSSHQKSVIVRELKRECDCWPCALSDEVSEQIREMYQWFGYFQAVADVDIRQTGYDSYAVVARVQEGPQYRLRDIEFVGARAFPVAQLRRLFSVQPDEPFDTRQIRAGLDAVRRLYSRNGYINFTPVPDTQVDPAAHTILLRIDLNEGTRFRFGPLLLTGAEPSPGVGKKLLADWNSYLGRPYDPDLLERFIDEHALLLKLHSANFFFTNVETVQDAQNATIAVRLRYPTELLR